MKRIVWLFGDGSTQYTELRLLPDESEREATERIVAIVGPALRVSPVKLDMTVRTEAERVAYEAALGAGAKARFVGVISEDEYMGKFNSLRPLREAWTWATPDPIIDIDMPKSRDIHRHYMRRVRTPLLKELDIRAMRGEDVEAQKQMLRDVTADPAIDAATTPEQLLVVWPNCLKGE